MGNMTLSMPEETMDRMRLFREIRWSEIARRAIEQRLSDLEAMERIASKSKLTMKDAEELAKKIKKAAAKRFMDAARN